MSVIRPKSVGPDTGLNKLLGMLSVDFGHGYQKWGSLRAQEVGPIRSQGRPGLQFRLFDGGAMRATPENPEIPRGRYRRVSGGAACVAVPTPSPPSLARDSE